MSIHAPRSIMFPMVEQVARETQGEDTFAIVGSEFPCYCIRRDKTGVIPTFNTRVRLSRLVIITKKNADKFSHVDCNSF